MMTISSFVSTLPTLMSVALLRISFRVAIFFSLRSPKSKVGFLLNARSAGTQAAFARRGEYRRVEKLCSNGDAPCETRGAYQLVETSLRDCRRGGGVARRRTSRRRMKL